MKTLESEEDGRTDEKYPENSSGSDTSPSANSNGCRNSLSSSPSDFETTPPIGALKYAPPEKKLKMSGETTLKEVDTCVKTLYHAFKRLLEEQDVYQAAEINRRQKDYLVRIIWLHRFSLILTQRAQRDCTMKLTSSGWTHLKFYDRSSVYGSDRGSIEHRSMNC